MDRHDLLLLLKVLLPLPHSPLLLRLLPPQPPSCGRRQKDAWTPPPPLLDAAAAGAGWCWPGGLTRKMASFSSRILRSILLLTSTLLGGSLAHSTAEASINQPVSRVGVSAEANRDCTACQPAAVVLHAKQTSGAKHADNTGAYGVNQQPKPDGVRRLGWATSTSQRTLPCPAMPSPSPLHCPPHLLRLAPLFFTRCALRSSFSPALLLLRLCYLLACEAAAAAAAAHTISPAQRQLSDTREPKIHTLKNKQITHTTRVPHQALWNKD